MRLLTYAPAGPGKVEPAWRTGVLLGEIVVDVAQAAQSLPRSLLGEGPALTVRRLLGSPPRLRAELLAAAHDLARAGQVLGALTDLWLGPPVPDPDKIVCVALNYPAHAAETGLDPPGAPTLFAKFRTSLVGSGRPVTLPTAVSSQVDYEGELGVVIGRRARAVQAADALTYVGGYLPFNDLTARDLQFQTSQWTAGKALDGFAPCGPALVTADEVLDPQRLSLTTHVNGERRQSASTGDMIFRVARLIAFMSSLMTLEPGDIIATGTPDGVGFARTPATFLQPGDTVTVTITDDTPGSAGSLGTLSTTMRAPNDPPTTTGRTS